MQLRDPTAEDAGEKGKNVWCVSIVVMGRGGGAADLQGKAEGIDV